VPYRLFQARLESSHPSKAVIVTTPALTVTLELIGDALWQYQGEQHSI